MSLHHVLLSDCKILDSNGIWNAVKWYKKHLAKWLTMQSNLESKG